MTISLFLCSYIADPITTLGPAHSQRHGRRVDFHPSYADLSLATLHLQQFREYGQLPINGYAEADNNMLKFKSSRWPIEYVEALKSVER